MILLNETPVKYRKAKEEKNFITKNIRFEKPIGENINRVISTFNKSEKVMKINNDVLVNIAVNEYLNSFDDDAALLHDLKIKALEL